MKFKKQQITQNRKRRKEQGTVAIIKIIQNGLQMNGFNIVKI